MSTLKVSLVQAQIQWHDPAVNLSHFETLVSSISDADLIILPEMWASGFTMLAHKYYEATIEAVELMKKWSTERSAVVVGSLITKVEEKYFNRLYVVSEGMVKFTYDKKHLFAFAGEDRIFTSGSKQINFKIKDWVLNPQICYDLRFPVWLRNTTGYDILIFSANWPNKRIAAWDALLKARAIENQAYVLGVNCFGADAWKNNYDGHSAIVNYDGTVLETLKGKEGILQATLDLQSLKDYRKELPFLKDQDGFVISK